MLISAEEIVSVYKETGSVWKTGKRLGITGQRVYSTLVSLQYPLSGTLWTEEEKTELKSLVEAGVSLSEAATRLGRPFGGVAVKAAEMNLKVKKAKAGKAGRAYLYNKKKALIHMNSVEMFTGPISQYALANGLAKEPLIQALEKYYPERWREYVKQRSNYPPRLCEYCGEPFIPFNGKQRFHSRLCAAHARSDRQYFNGKRRETVGLAEGICQLCGKTEQTGLSSHHVLGKENDPEATYLVALCRGCHKAVTFLGSRTFVDNEEAWEALIAFAWLRRHGGDLPPGEAIRVTVDIDVEETP